MNQFLYTSWDNVLGLYHGSFETLSADDAKKLIKQFSDSVMVKLWKRQEDIPATSSCWPKLNMWYFLRKKTDKLVFAFPITSLVARIVFLLLLIPMIFVQHSLLHSSFVIGLISLTFIYSRKIIVFHDHIIYKKRIFLNTVEKRIDISNATKALFKGIQFESFSGKCETGYFVYLEKDGQKRIVFGDTDVSMRSISKLAVRIGSFLKVPVEEDSISI